MDTATYKSYTDIAIKSIRAIDSDLADKLQQYVDACVAEKDGTGTKEATQAIMDTLPKHKEMHPDVASLVTESIKLTFVYMLESDTVNCQLGCQE